MDHNHTEKNFPREKDELKSAAKTRRLIIPEIPIPQNSVTRRPQQANGDETRPVSTLKTRRLVNTRRRVRIVPEYKMTVEYYQRMEHGKIHTLDITLKSETKDNDPPPLEEGRILIVPILPGCLVTPAQMIVDVTASNTLHFDVTPMVKGYHNLQIEISDLSKKYKSMNFPLQVMDNKTCQNLWRAGIVFLAGFILHAYQLEPDGGSLALFLKVCGGMLYPAIFISLIFLGRAIHIHRQSQPLKQIRGEIAILLQ